MGSLPKQRVTAWGPFKKVGVDFADPISIKNSLIRRAIETKGYICIFVCFATKAIHLELASDITTKTFLACFKKLFSRRLPDEVFADNGSNFKGAASQLAELYTLQASSDHQKHVNAFLSQTGIRFHFTHSIQFHFCYSPVFAGLAEAAVKSTKFVCMYVRMYLFIASTCASSFI